MNKRNSQVTACSLFALIFLMLLIIYANNVSAECASTYYCRQNIYVKEPLSGVLDFGTVKKGTKISYNMIIGSDFWECCIFQPVPISLFEELEPKSRVFSVTGLQTGDTFAPPTATATNYKVLTVTLDLTNEDPSTTESYMTQYELLLGQQSANLVYDTPPPPKPIIITVKAVGEKAAGPAITCDPRIDFGLAEIGTQVNRELTCYNTGDVDGKIEAVAPGVGDLRPFTTDMQGNSTIPRDYKQVFNVSFIPASTQQETRTLEITFDDGSSQKVELTGQGKPKCSENHLFPYDLYADLPEAFTLRAGQGQVFIVDIAGPALFLAENNVKKPGSPYRFDTVLARDAKEAAFGQPASDGHYIYAIVLDQKNTSRYMNSQFMVMDLNYTNLFDQVMMGTMVVPTGWDTGNVPAISVSVNRKKALFVESASSLKRSDNSLTMELATNWASAPSASMTGDYYLILVNQDMSKTYCYDFEKEQFNFCSPVTPAIRGITPGFVDNGNRPFHIPFTENGVWRVYSGIITDDGNVFYDQAVIVTGQAANFQTNYRCNE